jgi:hypothetical protein
MRKPCLDCGTPTDGTRCPTCQEAHARTHEAARPTRAQRGYDSEHDRRAAQLRKTADEDDAACALCGGSIDYHRRSPDPMSFVAHHTTRDKRGPIEPAHRLCNERAGQPTP